MLKRNVRHLIFPLLLVAGFSLIVPAARNSFLILFKYPLRVSTFLTREIKGLIFYHRNFTENEKLAKNNDLLRYKLNEYEEVSAENKRLKQLLSLKDKSPYKLIAAKTIGRPADNWASAIIIDKGENNGIKRGLVVINYSGLLGRVIEASRTMSKVMLINDPDFGVSALIQRSRQEGLITGTLGDSLALKYLSKDCDVKITDTVVTSGLTKFSPKGLLIGTVIGLREEFSGLSYYAVIKPAVDLSSLEEVLVIIQ